MSETVEYVKVKDVIGGGYDGYCDTKKRYRVLLGGRASKKSKTAALDYILKIMEYENSNLLCIRKVFKDHRDSTYAELMWAINRLGVQDDWKGSVNPFEIKYLPTGQKILFRGLDDPQSITSITVEKGNLCWVWFEEAFQVSSEDDFDKVDGSIRGMMPEHLFKQITLTFNPWSERHWIKPRFWDHQEKPVSERGGDGWTEKTYEEVFTLQTNYFCNEFLDEKDKKYYDNLKAKNPRRYWIEGLGNWGQAEGLIFTNWEEKEFDFREILKTRTNAIATYGLDFGFTAPTGFIASIVDNVKKELFVFDEIYESQLTNELLYKRLQAIGCAKEKIVADSADPYRIAELKKLGVPRIVKSRKGGDSIKAGIQFLQGFKIYVHPKCTNFNFELNNYYHDKKTDEPCKDYNHLIDPLRYSVEEFSRQSGIRFFSSNRRVV